MAGSQEYNRDAYFEEKNPLPENNLATGGSDEFWEDADSEKGNRFYSLLHFRSVFNEC